MTKRSAIAPRASTRRRTAHDTRSGKADRDAASKAVLDNMAKLKALRLAREAAEPPRVAAAKESPCQGEGAGHKKAPALLRLAGEPAKRRTAEPEATLIG